MKKTPLEETEQKAFIQWLRLNNIFHFAIMNENNFSFLDRDLAIKLQAKAKAMGALKGASDTVVFTKGKILFIELKRLKGSKVSKEQLAFGEEVNKYDYASYYICNGYLEAIKTVESHITIQTPL